MVAVSVSIVTVFVTSFTLPYLMNADYANLGPEIRFHLRKSGHLHGPGRVFHRPRTQGSDSRRDRRALRTTHRFLASSKKAVVASTDFERPEIEVLKGTATATEVEQVGGSAAAPG